ncbi:MAG: allantoinase AllB [Candidatus Sulfomarinibacteraceae bacterium]
MRTRFMNLRIPAGGNETRPAEIVVSDGLFDEILPAGTETAAGGEQWINLRGGLVLPGVIDGHVHFDDPGFTHREDFASGTAAAAAGGVTCVVDMPCTSLPPVTDTDALAAKVRAIQTKAYVDFGLWGGVSGNVIEGDDWKTRLEELVEAGVGAIKVYCLSGMDSFRALDDDQMEQVFEAAAELGIPVGVHAEDATVVGEFTREARDRGGDEPADYAASRPVLAEVAAIRRIISSCRRAGARVHIVHLSSGSGLDLVTEARKDGVRISAETCPHFLQFTLDDLLRQGSLLKTAPVVKSIEDRERLWRGAAAGELAFIATDHAPGQWPEEKHTGSIWTDYGGVPGVETLLPYLLSEGVSAGRITLEQLMELTAAGPARFFGFDDRKGALREGLDADFVVLDDDVRWTVTGSKLHNLNRYTPFEGHEFIGRVRATYVRGQAVFERKPDGRELFAPAGRGRWIQRRPA